MDSLAYSPEDQKSKMGGIGLESRYFQGYILSRGHRRESDFWLCTHSGGYLHSSDGGILPFLKLEMASGVFLCWHLFDPVSHFHI